MHARTYRGPVPPLPDPADRIEPTGGAARAGGPAGVGRADRAGRPALPKAVLWDMDGTLVDSEPEWMAAETALVERFGGTWSHEQALTLVGSGLEDAARVLQDHGVRLPVGEIVEAMTDSVLAGLQRSLPWRPGALELLRALREAGVPTALVTMSVRRMALGVAGATGFDAFDVVVSGTDIERPKPHPEPYERAAALLGVPIGETVAIEDSPPGVASAVTAGAAVVGVPAAADLPGGDAWTVWPTLAGRTVDDLAAVLAAHRAARPTVHERAR